MTLQKNTDLSWQMHEFTYRRYLMTKEQITNAFHDLSEPEYIVLQTIAEGELETEQYPGRTYLRKLAEKMQMTIQQASRLVDRLKERGLLIWSHDGKGEEGTYTIITETGKEMIAKQDEIMKSFYENVVERYGKDNIVQLLTMMKDLEIIMYEEHERMMES